jgi:hypothetical protein
MLDGTGPKNALVFLITFRVTSSQLGIPPAYASNPNFRSQPTA